VCIAEQSGVRQQRNTLSYTITTEEDGGGRREEEEGGGRRERRTQIPDLLCIQQLSDALLTL